MASDGGAAVAGNDVDVEVECGCVESRTGVFPVSRRFGCTFSRNVVVPNQSLLGAESVSSRPFPICLQLSVMSCGLVPSVNLT